MTHSELVAVALEGDCDLIGLLRSLLARVVHGQKSNIQCKWALSSIGPLFGRPRSETGVVLHHNCQATQTACCASWTSVTSLVESTGLMAYQPTFR